jgi:uncharacterized protein (TIRG00374 family)
LKDKLLLFLKITISLGLVAYVVTRPVILEADWRSMLSQLRLWPWLLGLAIYFIAIGLQVLKWQILLETLAVPVPYRSLFRHNLVGLFFALLPLSMIGGDIARGWDLVRHTEGQGAPVAVSVLVDRLIGLAAFLLASVGMLAYAVLGLDRPDLIWLLSTMAIITTIFALAFAVLMSQRLRKLFERVFRLGPLSRLLPLYQRLSESVQGYRTQARALVMALGLGLATVAATCVVNYLAAATVNAEVPFIWVCVFTPLTPFALYIPSIASGLGVNQAVFVGLYHNLAGLIEEPPALALSLAMQVIIYASSLPGAVLWWRRRQVRGETGAESTA